MITQQAEGFAERRKHRRYPMPDEILVFNETTFGQIINISRGGIAFRFLTNKDIQQDSTFELGILNSADGFYLENIPCRTVTSTDSAPIHPTGSTIVRRNGAQFGDLTSDQQQKIDAFLEAYAARAAMSQEETAH
ncbi:MAG: PilZ domain-containing protein [Thermodesulfobacteriota bacterium]